MTKRFKLLCAHIFILFSLTGLVLSTVGCGRIWSSVNHPNSPVINSPVVNHAFVHYSNDVFLQNPGNFTDVVLNVAPTTAGHLLVVASLWFNTATAPTVTDNKGNVWQELGSPVNDGNGDWGGVFYTNNALGGVTTVTVAANGNQSVSGAFSEFSGANITSPVDGYL